MIGFKPKNDHDNQNLHSDIKLYYCAFDGCETNKFWGPGMIDHYKLFYCIEGHGTFTLGNDSYPIQAGRGFVIHPETLTSYAPVPGSQWRYFWVAFNGVNALNYIKRAGIKTSSPLFSPKDPVSFLENFKILFHTEFHPKSMDIRALAAFYNLIGQLIDEAEVDPVFATDKELYLNQAVEFMNTNFSRPISIEVISDHISVNRKYLYQIFKDKMNRSPKQYLLDLRIKKSEELLKDSTLSIAEVANSVGYPDPFLFSKMFKQRTGHAPSAYRKKTVNL